MSETENKVYILDAAANRYEGMTKEQIIVAITQAVNDGTISNIDAGFITKIQEMNKQRVLKWWVGTQAEFNALETKDADTLYIFTDDPLYQDLLDVQEENEQKFQTLTTNFVNLTFHLNDLKESSRLIATRNKNILRNFDMSWGSSGFPIMTFNLDMSNMEAGTKKILFNFHLDAHFNWEEKETESNGGSDDFSIDIPFFLEWKRTTPMQDTVSFEWALQSNGSDDDKVYINIPFYDFSHSTFHYSYALYISFTASISHLSGTRICDVKVGLSSTNIHYAKLSNSNNVLGEGELTSIKAVNAYIEQINGIVEGD